MNRRPAIEQLLSTLNPQQKQAVTHDDGPLLIVAGAGTGKTATLVHRVAWQIAQGVNPAKILLLTFTRRHRRSRTGGGGAAAVLRRSDKGQKWLYVCCPLRYYHTRRPGSDQHGYAQQSRFLTESVLKHFEPHVTQGDDLDEVDPGAESTRRRTRDLWS